MGKAFSVALRPFQNYNAKSRAHKFLDAEIPKAAPRHPNDRTWKEASKHGFDELNKKDDQLLNKLKSVYVVSQESMTLAKASSERPAPKTNPLPTNRRIVDHPLLGYVEPERVTEGKVSLMHAINFIMEHQSDPEKVTVKAIANEYKLDEAMVGNILKHFSAFQLHVPHAEEEEATIVQRIAQLPKMLVEDANKDKNQP